MKFTRLEIPDILLIEPKVHEDSRGSFFESYREDLFRASGIRDRFVQENQTRSAKGVLRGLHYQIPPFTQGKALRVLGGSIFDVVVDLRRKASTFGRHVHLILRAEEKKMLYVPAGFAHGFCALEDGTEVLYKVSKPYSPSHERGVFWKDPALKISWPRLDCEYILSLKDQKYPVLKDAETF